MPVHPTVALVTVEYLFVGQVDIAQARVDATETPCGIVCRAQRSYRRESDEIGAGSSVGTCAKASRWLTTHGACRCPLPTGRLWTVMLVDAWA